MNVVFRIIGVLLVGVAIRDVFHTLFHPAREGIVSDRIARIIWRLVRRVRPKALTVAGPAAFLTIVAYWTLSNIVGFALVYQPELPQGFKFTAGLDPHGFAGFWGAMQISVGSLITLSTGAYASETWMGLVMGFESIVGFGLLTASVSWILSIYPILEHRKSLGHEASMLHFSELHGIRRLREISDSEVNEILLGLASQLITSRNEMIQFPITYYFHENEQKTSLAGALSYMADLAELNKKRAGAAALAATVLGGAVDDFLEYVAGKFLRQQFRDRREILVALAQDHLRTPLRAPETIRKAA